MRALRVALLCAAMCACTGAIAQQVPDRDYRAPLAKAEYAAGKGPVRPSRGPSRVGRRPIGGIGGQGVTAGTPLPISQRRDIIVGKFASEHQYKLDDEILALLAEDQ